MKIMKKILSGLGTAVTIFLVLIMITVFISRLSGNTPNVFGYSFYRIATDSMTPSLEVGDIILSKRVKDFSSLELEDVITYNCEKGKMAGMSITHRIVEIDEVDGEFTFQTQGTKQGAKVDEYPVEEHQVEAVMVCEIPLLGKLVTLLLKPYIFFIIIIVPLIVCLFFEVKKLVVICKNKEEEVTDEKEE